MWQWHLSSTCSHRQHVWDNDVPETPPWLAEPWSGLGTALPYYRGNREGERQDWRLQEEDASCLAMEAGQCSSEGRPIIVCTASCSAEVRRASASWQDTFKRSVVNVSIIVIMCDMIRYDQQLSSFPVQMKCLIKLQNMALFLSLKTCLRLGAVLVPVR